MNKTKNLIDTVDIHRIADEGTKIYEKIKKKYDPKEYGKYLAIEIESGKAYLGDTSDEAIEESLEHHPDKVFYVVKIGFDAVETLATPFFKHNLA